MTTGILHHDQTLEKHIEKQMGCMTGFLHLFDRNQILSGKRLYTTKRLPPSSPAVDSTSESDTTVGSPSISRELVKVQQNPTRSAPSPDRFKQYHVPELRSPAPEFSSPAETPAKMPLPLPIFDFKEGTKSSWKFRESPRLSLDSRAIVDAKGSLYPREIRTNAAILSRDGAVDDGEKQRRSPSVIARLMGLEQLPHSRPEPMMKKAELRRSASESRASRDLGQYRFVDGNNHNFQHKQNQSNADSTSNVIRGNARIEEHKSNARTADPIDYTSTRTARSEQPKATQRGMNASSPWRSPQQRKSYFDSADFFPEPKQTVSIYGEIEKRLRMRGIDEPSKDLETLKQILDALQLKGLLHSKKSLEEQLGYRNFVFDRNFSQYDDSSPIVLMKPSRSPPVRQGRTGNDSPPPSHYRSRPAPRRNINPSGDCSPAGGLRRDSHEIDRNGRNSPRGRSASSPSRSESSVTSTNSVVVRRKPLTVETPRRGNDSVEQQQQRRTSPVHSPKVAFRRTASSDHTQSPRNRKPTVEIHPRGKPSVPAEDESSSFSESTISTSSQTDTERRKVEEYKEGRSLLDRCDKLLHSIAEMNTSELQPSPVSVLDSSFYKDDSSSPSPVMKRSIDFKDHVVDLEDEIWSHAAISPLQYSKQEEEEEEEGLNDDCDFLYISDILRASNYLPEDSDIFLLLEKQQYFKGNDTSKLSTLQRKVIFDTVAEILDRNRQLPPWKAISSTSSGIGAHSLHQIWSEFQKIRERDESDDLFDVIFGVLRKDLAGDAINGWGECHLETSEAVLDIERSIFKDLVGETIRDLAVLAGKSRGSVPRRKLVF